MSEALTLTIRERDDSQGNFSQISDPSNRSDGGGGGGDTEVQNDNNAIMNGDHKSSHENGIDTNIIKDNNYSFDFEHTDGGGGGGGGGGHLTSSNAHSASLLKLPSFRSERSLGITYASQHQLPRLPIPSLEQTLHKLPLVLEALQDAKQQEQTRKVAHDFLHGEGPLLQQALIDYEKSGVESGEFGSYVEQFWNESYLSPDASVVMNLNPFFVLEDAPDPKVAHDQLKRAAGLCFASIKIASLLKTESLPPDIFKGKPLCMDQFKALFGAARQPTDGSCDEVHVYSDSSHVAVLTKNQFYYFPALWPETGEVAVDETDILDILRAISINASTITQEEASRTALGALTSLPRSEWAVARKTLCEIEKNEKALHIIDSALFIVVLDDYTPDTFHSAAANMLHGTNQLAANDTYQVGTCLNRWYDKLQLIVCKDGTAGCNFEHSAIDGHTALRFISDVFAETVISFAESIVDLIHGRGRIQHVVEAKLKRAAGIVKKEESRSLDVYPKRIVFELSEEISDRIYFAETALCDEVSASDSCVLEFVDYGKLLVVANKFSPDSVVQMAIMIAYYKLYGKVVCTYEPVLTKSFYHGRTEAMRSATPQAKALCQIWCQKTSTKEEKLHALRIATVEHSRLVQESARGYGVDRHLFSLKCIAERKGMPVPAFFQSDAWKTLNHTVLSTSNCGNPALRLFGFGPVVPDGFGIGYIIKDYGISFSVSSKHRQTQRYVRSLHNVLKEIEAILEPKAIVQVEQHRPALREQQQPIKHHIFSYDDLYGENAIAVPDRKPSPPIRQQMQNPKTRHPRSNSKYLSLCKERSCFNVDAKGSFDYFDESAVHINLDLDGLEREISEEEF